MQNKNESINVQFANASHCECFILQMQNQFHDQCQGTDITLCNCKIKIKNDLANVL